MGSPRDGVMIALVPSDVDLDRLTLASGELRAELHLTLWFLGEASEITAETRVGLVNAVTSMIERRELPVVRARAFGVAHWNPASDDPAWVLNVGDVAPDDRLDREQENLAVVREMMHEAWFDGGVMLQPPPQHSPWQPHVCLAYSTDDLLAELETRLGELTFDRVRVAFGDDVTDVPLRHPATVAAATGGVTVPWHKTHNHSDCPPGKPWAVVKDGTDEVEGCHETEDAADRQLAALYASEEREQSAASDVDCVDCVDCTDAHEHFTSETLASDAPWNGAASRFTDEQYRRSAAACDSGDEPLKTRCFLPHHEPGGALNRNGVHAAAARFNEVRGRNVDAVARARSHLRSHYRQLGEEVPDVLKAEAADVTFAGRNDDDYDCPPGHHRMPDGSCMSDEEMATESRWSGVLVVEGTPTGDGREFAPNALTWVDGALLRWQKEGSHGGDHDVTVSVGRIDEVWRDGNLIRGRGVFDLLNPDGFELYRRMKNQFAGGISVDADDIMDADVEFVWPADVEGSEVVDEADNVVRLLFGAPEKMIFHGGRVRAATVVDIPAFVEACIALGDDGPVHATTESFTVHHTETSDEPWNPRHEHVIDVDPAFELACALVTAEGNVLMHHDVLDDDELGPANLTACAAGIHLLNGGRDGVDLSIEARRVAYEHLATHLRDAGMEPPQAEFETAAIVASVPDEWRPPRAWFDDPELSVPTPITVTTQGRIYGHAAQWGECHIGFSDECVTVPYEDSHPYFTTGEIVCVDGTTVAVGQITVGTGHAPLAYRASRAVEHYDNTGCAVADVAIGNDRHGLWVAGAVRPHVEVGRVHDLRASGQVSGDWRRIGGQLRLVGLLAVNVPGFPVPRTQARVAAGTPLALVAAGQTSIGRAPAPTEEQRNQEALRRVMNILAERVHRNHDVEGEPSGV